MHNRGGKVLNLLRAWTRNAFGYTTPFVRVLPTDRCNLNCRYCFQHEDRSGDMTLQAFDACLAQARRLGVGLISFLGGEPLLWAHLGTSIRHCTEHRVFTDVTTNGTLLDAQTVLGLAAAGLDFLNVSVDVCKANRVSAKDSILRPERLAPLLQARARHGLKLRVNSVLYKDNSEEIKELIEFTHAHRIPISIGFIVPDFCGPQDKAAGCYFGAEDRVLLDGIVDHIVDKKTRGYQIIDTRDYFRNFQRFLRGEQFWDCNYQRRFGWINITPNGRIRSCTKKMDELPDRYIDLTVQRVRELRAEFQANIRECNVHCYSNCAYNAYHFFHHLPTVMFRYVLGHYRPRWN